MNPRMTRMLAMFTGFLAICSVAAAALLGLRLQSDRAVLQELRQSTPCLQADAAKKGGAR